LDDLLSAFLERGIPGATVVDTVGMGHIVSQNIPVFAGLRDFLPEAAPLTRQFW